MRLYLPAVPVRYSALLLDYLRSAHAARLGQILAAAGLEESAFEMADTSMSWPQWEALVQASVAQTGCQDLGFEIGRRISLNTQGAMKPALQGCTTVDQALRLATRYFCLLTPGFRMQYRRNAAGGELLYRPTTMMQPETLRSFYEIHAVSLYMQLRQVLQQRLGAYDVYLSMDAPPHLRRYRELRPARFHFGSLPLPEVRVVLPSDLLDQPLLTATGQAASEEELARIRDKLPRAGSWSEWAVLMLREADGCQPTLHDLAGLMDIGERTLSRHLASEGRNFRELAVQVRYQRACKLLRNPANSITRIAFQLGFGHSANFSAAFQRASGLSPIEYRNSLTCEPKRAIGQSRGSGSSDRRSP